MFEEMIRVAKNKLATINEPIDSLPSSQVTVLLTTNNNIYMAVNDIDGMICEELKRNKDTKVLKMLTMWKDGGLDLSSIRFRNALIEMNEQNNNTDVILQGKEDYLIKKLSVTII
ncbi:MAG: hypothetical protein IJ292_01845 [Clostridia bacterium]|nr:hypothetical protein [Clostridia bacterium]